MADVKSLTPAQMANAVDKRTQEQGNQDDYIEFFNSCIRWINMQLGTEFPTIDQTLYNQPYVAIPEPWCEMVILFMMSEIYYANGMPEYSQLKWGSFAALFVKFQNQFKIADEYLGTSDVQNNVVFADWKKTPWYGINNRWYTGPVWIDKPNVTSGQSSTYKRGKR